MKKVTLLFLSILFIFGCQNETVLTPAEDDNDFSELFNLSEKEVVKGVIRVKLKEEPTGAIGVRSSATGIITGIRSLDPLATPMGISKMERTFPPCGKFEERSRRKGLHLWYDVYISEDIPATRAAGDVAMLEGIDIASPVLKVVSTSIDAPFNDPSLSSQWSYHNPGTEFWQVEGADIRLFDVWEAYNGHPDIIVAVVDEGIDYDHPDLKDNMWVNEGEISGNGMDDDGNGYADDVYGYNFVRPESGIYPERHGTHVAGTIGAVSNNNTGIAGIAGGNGTPNSGVKIMCCQIIQNNIVTPNTAAAIKYGADNGAVISQNSWGYAIEENGTRSSYIEPALKEAIDYFVEFAGCDNDGNQLPGSPMKGGIVFFAAGNANSSNPRVAAPADYENVLGVAAIGPDYKKAPYSNYGDYVDICAPGGLANDISGIYSTTIRQRGYYEARHGTSMACPHVAGVAALIVQKYGVGKPGFTATRLEEILLTTAYDVDSYNNSEAPATNYTGLLGTGCVNAFDALYDEPPVAEPFTIATNIITDGKISFKVNSEYAGSAHITIINNMGIKVIDQDFQTRRYLPNTFDISALAPGYYSFHYEYNGKVIKEKIIKY